jgi:AbrB family looped-hinge helix DNA binding protein
MFKDNLIQLRRLKNLSQEQVAAEIGISRQAYAKWESGKTIPDIEKCQKLAEFYQISIDQLASTNSTPGDFVQSPPGKKIWGCATIGQRGQIVLCKGLRESFSLKPGDRLVVCSDEVQGIALIPKEVFEQKMQEAMHLSKNENHEGQEI